MSQERIDSYIDLAALTKETDLAIAQIERLKAAKNDLRQIRELLSNAANNKELINALNASVKVEENANRVLNETAKTVSNVEKSQKLAAKSIKENAAETEKLVGAYDRLKKQFQEADKEAKNLAAEFGTTSEQATKAAESAAALKAQLVEINALSKTGITPKVQEVPFTHNLNADGTVKEPTIGNTTGAVVNDVEKAQVEGILTAKEYAAAQKGVSASFVESQSNAKKYAVTQKEIDLALAQDKLNAQKRTAELKNQVREENAVKGSLEQRRAALIRLNAVYDNLSPQERNSAAGQRLQKITKGITDQLKELEAASGRAQRNVGNYPTNSFNGLKAQLKDVTDQYNNLTKQEQKSATGKDLKNKMDELSKSVKGFGETSSISFSKAYSGLRILANIIPGLGISGIFLLAGEAIASTVQWIKDATTKVVDFAAKMKVLSEVNLKAIESFGSQRSHIEGLTAVIRDGNASLDDKKRALNDLIELDPKYLNGLTLANINTKEGKKLLEDYNDLLRRKAELEAATAVQGDASKEVYKLEVIKDLLRKRLVATKTNYDDLTEEELKYVDKVKTSTGRINFTASLLNLEIPKSDIQEMLVGVDKELTKAGKKVTASLDVFKDKFKAVGNEDVKLGIIESLKKQITDIDKQIDTETVKSKISGLVTARKDLQKQLDDLLGKEHSTKSAKDVKTLSDVVKELRKELSTLAEQEAIGQITPKEADIEKVKAYDKAFKGLFDLKATASTPIVKQLVVEVKPISDRVIQGQLHDLVSKLKTDPIEIAPPNVAKAIEIGQSYRDGEVAFTEEMLQRELVLQQTASLKEQAILEDKYAAGKISREDYEKENLAIQSKYAKEAVAAQIKSIQAQIALMDVGTKGREDAEKRLAEIQLKYNQIVADDRKKKNSEVVKDIEKVQEVFNVLATLGSGLANAQATKAKNELQDLEDTRQTNYEQEVERVKNSTLTEAEKADRIKILDAERQAQKEQYDRKNREIQQRQAKIDKDIAIMNIILNTAVSIAKVLGNPFQVALAAALGAVELAVAISTPIPKFKSGKLTDYSGPAIVGDGGKQEVIVRESGAIELTPAKDTFTYLGRKDFVYPDIKTFTSTISTKQTDRIITNSTIRQDPNKELVFAYRQSTSQIVAALNKMPAPRINFYNNGEFNEWVKVNVRGKR